MANTYRVQQFARLAGVTVKTLHHYDRLGLLRPERTAAGYRVFSERDLHRLAEISALKLVGVPLKQIASLLAGSSRSLDEILLSQRHVLETKRGAIGRAIEAIDDARRVREAGGRSDAEILRTLIEAIEMQNNVDVLQPYFEPDAWERWRSGHDEWPDAEWRSLLHEIENALDHDPTTLEAGALAERWNELAKRDAGGDTGVRVAFMKAWRQWLVRPETRPPQLAAFDMDRILAFVVNAADAEHERRRLASPETARVPPRTTPSRLQLFREARELLGTSPAGPQAQRLVERLQVIVEREIGGDEEARAAQQLVWNRRPHWPAGVTRWMAMTYDMDAATWTAVADFLDAARVSSGRD